MGWIAILLLIVAQSLRSLLSKVIKSDPHFVRCIRPNIQNIPDMFDEEKVLQQLQYTGVLETCKIRQKGYSERIFFKDFITRYKFLMYEYAQKIPETGDICDKLLVAANIDEEKEWKIGKTKVFLRYYHAERLSKCYEKYRSYVIKGQKAIRFWLMRRKVKQFSNYRHLCASKIRAQWLAYRLRKRYLRLREEERSGKKRMTAEDLAGKRPEEDKPNEKSSKKASNKEKEKPVRQHRSLFDRARKKEKPAVKLSQRQKLKSLREYVAQVQKLNEQKKREKEENDMNEYEIVEQNYEAFIPDRTEYLESKIRDTNNKFRDEEEQQFRPYFRNVKRERRGYDDYEEFYNQKEEGSRKDLPTNPLSKIPNHKYKKVNDPEGQAALEETRAIILLSQIELASKEALEMLNRTSYPVIHSVRERAAINAGQGLRNQRLDHKDRQIAVVDGFGDPLQQKYRLAKFHYAKSIKEEEVDQPEYPNAPMLGLVEKPRREKKSEPVQTEKKEPVQKQPIKKTRQQQYKPANNKLERKEVRKEKRVPKPKAVDNGFSYSEQNYYPSRNPKNKQQAPEPSSSEWFYPGRRNQNLLEEKKMIDNRLADKEKELREQRKKYQDYHPAENHYVTPKNLPWKVHEDYRPYNYLLNDRVDPTSVFGHDNINHSPIGRRKYLNQHNHTPTASKQVINQPPSFNERKKLVQSRPPQPLPKKEKQQTPYQVFYPSRRRPPTQNEYNDTTNWFEPTPLPGLATSPYPGNTNPTSTAASSDYYDYRDSDYRPKKKKLGFNYGLNQDNILHDLKLKKTGRLQELLVK